MDYLQNIMMKFGITSSIEITYDGEIQRFRNTDDKNKNSWYVAFDHGEFQSGAFGCWKLDVNETFCSIEQNQLTTEQKQQYIAKQEEQKLIASQEKIKQQQCVQKAVNKRLYKASTTNISIHPYLVDKKVMSYGLCQEKEYLLVPISNADDEIVNLQTISHTGEKRFTKGGRVTGCFLLLGKPKEVLILCEGYATGASIYEATCTSVAVCFNSSNIKEVGKELSSKFPNAKVVIAGDDDHRNERNIGRIKAVEAAKHIGATTTFPKFDIAHEVDCTDFNDLHRVSGLNEVKRQINKAIHDSERAVSNGSFVFYESFYESMKNLSNGDKSDYIDAICEYGLFERQAKLNPVVQSLFVLVKPQLKANINKRKNGKKGGRPVET